MSANFLPRLKTGTENRLVLPREVGVWNDDQAKGRLQALARAIEVQPGAGQVHSIPDPWARVILFGRALFDEKHPLHAKVLGEWRGLLAILGLRDIRRFSELKVVPVSLEGKNGATEVKAAAVDGKGVASNGRGTAGGFLSTISRLKPSVKESFADGVTWERFHLLRWNGVTCGGDYRVFGLTSPATLVATGVDYSEVFSRSEVPWFVNGVLVDPITPVGDEEEAPGDLSTSDRRALAEWVLYVKAELATAGDEDNIRHGRLLELLEAYAEELSGEARLRASVDLLAEQGMGFEEPELYRCLDRPRRPESQVLTDLQIVTERPVNKVYVLYAEGLAKQLRRQGREVKEREVTVFETVTLASAVRHYEGISRSRSGALGRNKANVEVVWCTPDFFFQDDLIYEQLDAEAVTFPGCLPVHATGRIERRQIALPLTEDAARLFTPEYLAKNFSIDWLRDGGATCKLKLRLQSAAVSGVSQSDGASANEVTIEHTYAEKDLNKIRNLPLVCVWPNFRFLDEPANAELLKEEEHGFRNRWKRYYLFESWPGSGKAEELMVTPLDVKDPEKRLFTQKSGVFQVTVTPRFPEVLVCQMPFTDRKPRHEMRPPKGLLLLRSEPEAGGQSARTALGVDFGTTGTSIYRARVAGAGKEARTENAAPMTFLDRMLQVTGISEAEMKDLTRHHFIPARIKAMGRILSVYQSHDSGRGRSEVIDGHVLYQDPDTDRPAPFVWGLYDMVRTNLKWGDDTLEADAAEAFLAQLCVQSLAELVAGGATAVDIRYSYPTAFDDVDLRRFHRIWEGVLADVQGATSVPITANAGGADNYEAVAAARFFARSGDLNIMGGAMTLDIGGGTTDLAVWNQAGGRPALIAHSSVLFAGTDMFQGVLRKKLELLKKIDEDFPVPTLDREKYPSAYFAEVDALISMYGDKLLRRLSRASQESEAIQQFTSILELGMTGIAFYSGLVLGELVRSQRYDTLTPLIQVFVGGNASKLLHWCDLGKFQQGTPFYRKFTNCILEGVRMGAPALQSGAYVEVHISTKPKEEVAYGLVAVDLETERTSDHTQPLAGERFQVGTGEVMDWNQSPDLPSLLTGQLRVEHGLPVFSSFLELIGEEVTESEKDKIFNSINNSLMKMTQTLRQQAADPKLAKEIRTGEKLNPVRKQPLFILALKRLIDMKISRLVEGA